MLNWLKELFAPAPICRIRGIDGVWWLEFYSDGCIPSAVWYDDLKKAQRMAEWFNNREYLKAFN